MRIILGASLAGLPADIVRNRGIQSFYRIECGGHCVDGGVVLHINAILLCKGIDVGNLIVDLTHLCLVLRVNILRSGQGRDHRRHLFCGGQFLAGFLLVGDDLGGVIVRIIITAGNIGGIILRGLWFIGQDALTLMPGLQGTALGHGAGNRRLAALVSLDCKGRNREKRQ
ncbi:hypothetical protein ADH75_07200 [Flavonifractor plautii]|uniref:Uncharacterized protein n=1 Tax=Flavonifractor plautii TaxID=292800 RepID=A0AAX1KIN1_FLAPL|nr:hypothetical protein [Flavonifractor plautii]ANU41452.1 hypothetical protein A4U99_10350 [Flavonifractor plautii]OXE49314.1 hypothetical protein ADH75_07200 [Flavonifractor plautii]QQR05693.1 hypothetical protein I5Q84_17425 [Flavonifractor plautii]UQA26506.1 hypothetical protein M2853_17835 [Flavonifractor plautii]